MLTIMMVLIIFILFAILAAIITGIIAISPILLMIIGLPLIDILLIKVVFKRKKKK